MGNAHSRPEERFRYINREVNALQWSLKTSRQNISKAKKESIVENLAHYSSEVIAMNGRLKRKSIEETLKKISDTMEEVLKIDPSELDAGAIESDSFINVTLNQKRSSSLGSLMSSKKGSHQEQINNRNSLPTLRDIEAKVNELKTQIGTAIDNKDTAQLRVYQKTVKVLATDLESIRTDRDTLLNKRKESIGKKIGVLHQKVIRAQNELKRDDRLRSQSTQNKKEKAINELADIETQLAQNESLLDKLFKEKQSSDFTAVRNNIVSNNQRLAKVDIVDNEVKEKVVLLSQKLTETVKTLDRIMAKREFESKFNKSLENYDRIIRNANADDTVTHLETLRNSVENIEEINEITRNRKKDLLNNIAYQIDSFQTDKKIIEQIVEDNVILRKRVKSTDKEHTVIDQFINHWENVKSNFKVNAYSNLSLLRIDGVLEEMQESINEIRLAIAKKCDTNPPTNLTRKRSQSLPKLNNATKKSLDDQLDGKIIKTRAKMYNLSTPELMQNALQEQQNYVNKRFSKIEEIKMQVHYIKEKIDDSHNKNMLRDKLERFRKNLETYTNDANKTVQNNAIFVSNEIIELLHKLVLAEFSERIGVLSKRVFNFNGTRYDKGYEDISQDLIETQLNLEAFNVPLQFDLLVHEKNELLDKLASNLDTLQDKTLHYRKQEDDNVKAIKSKLQELGDKIARFSGSYKDVLYNSIERDLNKLLLTVGEQVEDKLWSDELIKETEKLLKILENRASRAQSFRATKSRDENKSEEQIGMIKIKQDLYNIKREIDRTLDGNVEAFIGLQSRLDLVHLELSQISARSNENLAKEKDIFSNEAQTLKNVVDAKIALGQQPIIIQWPERQLLQTDSPSAYYPKNDVNKEIEQFERAFEEIKRKITTPNNEQDVHKSYTLAQDIKSLREKLSNYRFIRNTDLYTRQATLLREMQYYIEELEKGATDINYVLSIEKKLDNLENLFDSGQQQDLKTMAKELMAIQRKLKDHTFITTNEDLRVRKTSIQQKTNDLAQKLKHLEAQNVKRIDDVEETINDIAQQVSAFTGTKRDNQYVELNEATTKAILILDKIDTDNNERKQKLLRDLHMLAHDLNERAQQSQDIATIELALDEASLALDNPSGKQEDIKSIKNKIDDIKKHLQSLKVSNELIARKNACLEKFSVLFNKAMVLNSYATATRIAVVNADNPLLQIEQKIEEIETAAHNTEDPNKLQEFDENLTHYTIQIGKLNYPKTSPHYPKVIELYQRIETVTDTIEAKLQEHDRLATISEEVDKISNQMNTPLTYEQIDQLDERLIQLQVTLGKMSNAGMKAQIDGCMLRIILCLQKISEYKASVQGTAV